MNFVTADDSMQYWFRGIMEPVEVRDPSGRVLGHYTPLITPELKAAYERAAKLFDLEEAKRILATQGDQGRPLAEVLRHLRSVENPG